MMDGHSVPEVTVEGQEGARHAAYSEDREGGRADRDMELRKREASGMALRVRVSGGDKGQFQRAHARARSSQELCLRRTVDQFTPEGCSPGRHVNTTLETALDGGVY